MFKVFYLFCVEVKKFDEKGSVCFGIEIWFFGVLMWFCFVDEGIMSDSKDNSCYLKVSNYCWTYILSRIDPYFFV